MQKDTNFALPVFTKALFSSRSACADAAKCRTFAAKNRLARRAGYSIDRSAVQATTCDERTSKQPAAKSAKLARCLGAIGTCLILALPSAVAAASPSTADVLLKSGTIIDGTGHEPYIGDVAIAGGRIVGIGKSLNTAAHQTIDCKGLVIAPGFIDLHNHSDETITTDNGRAARCYLTQGCTTLVTGNCGGGRADVGAFYKELDAKGTGINIAQLIPAGSVREKVMGNVRREPTAAELKQMQELTEAAMQDGAWGISTGLQYVPGSFAKTDEIIALAQVVARRGGFYASHIRDEGDTLIESIQEVTDVGRGANT